LPSIRRPIGRGVGGPGPKFPPGDLLIGENGLIGGACGEGRGGALAWPPICWSKGPQTGGRAGGPPIQGRLGAAQWTSGGGDQPLGRGGNGGRAVPGGLQEPPVSSRGGAVRPDPRGQVTEKTSHEILGQKR